eukprot:Gregarina_sp_Pseudo_9__3422@NODE_3595_length_604_cov_2_263717_g3288_i0_p1_GENE_NODE_3595_length_604_cov_2_263717_g3288_i0NODE_3595_length_604_cov_2_263717_g3288_i0_p1_ORF_typecomplete_len109_score16_34_NODE_3595_length_604_cov_2_263717_g3288_i0156482
MYVDSKMFAADACGVEQRGNLTEGKRCGQLAPKHQARHQAFWKPDIKASGGHDFGLKLLGTGVDSEIGRIVGFPPDERTKCMHPVVKHRRSLQQSILPVLAEAELEAQ